MGLGVPEGWYKDMADFDRVAESSIQTRIENAQRVWWPVHDGLVLQLRVGPGV